MSNFTKEQIDFIERTILNLSVSGPLVDVIRLTHTTEDILAKLEEMKAELNTPTANELSGTPKE